MKNFNLIKRLFMDSHEKQSPQRFGRYAVMLLMLLTLGVGQMWAVTSVTVYCAINASTMKSGDDCYSLKVNANIGDNNTWVQTAMSIVDKTKNGKLIYSATFSAKYDGVDALQFQLYHNSTWKGQKQPYSSWTTATTFNGKMYDYDAGSWGAYSSLDATTTVYFVNTNSWATPKAFAWSGCTNNAAWSGQTMTSTGKALGGKTIYYITFNKRFENIIFSNNGSSQTSDLTLGSTNAGKMYDDGTWKTYQFDIALDQQSGSGGTSSVIGVVGSAMPASQTAPTRTGYTFGGYYTSTGGSGTCYYNASMVSQTNVSASTPNTLYAKWTKKTYTVTINNDGNGTTSPSGAQSSIAQVDGIAIDATANTNYEFVDWEIVSGTGSFASSTTTKSNRFYPTSAATIRANFRSTLTYSLTVTAGSHVGTVTGSTDPVTLGSSYAISASNFTSGYEFNNWTASPAANATFASSTSASTNVTVKNGSVTVTANAREISRTITISGGTDYTSGETTTTAGVATPAKIIANTPAAGKKFTGWTLGSGVSLKGGYSLTDRTIEIYSTANATVTANFADRAQVKMYFAKPTSLGWSKVYAYAWKSSDGSVHNKDYPGVELENTEVINCVTYYTYQYYTEGDGIGGAATGNSAWNRIVFGDNNDARKTGDLTISNGHYYYKTSTGTGKAAAITSAWGVKTSKDSFAGMNYITHNCATNSGTVDISFTGGNNYDFQVYNEVNDQWWSNSTAIGSSNPVTASMASTETLYNNDANNMQVNAALTGSYTFTVGSTNASNPTIKVTFPEIYAIVGSFNSWNTETNPLSMVGNTGTANIVLAPSGSNYTLKVVDDGSMYGKNSTTITGTTTVSSMSTSGANINLTADIYPASANPSYGFSYNKSTKALTVTYPSAHTVTYGVGTHAGTTSVTSSISVASGKKILDSQSITFSKGDTKTGYTWKGWYNNTSGSSSALGIGATYTSSSRAANTSVYACYNLVTYTITYNLNGGTNPGGAPTSFTIESSAVTLPTPTRTGYTFNGWYENADLSTGGVKTTIPAGSTGNKTYWAKWTPITYTIHFNGNGNTSGSMSDQTGITYDAATTITANAFVKTGYNFGGWATTQERANAGTVDRTDGAAHGNLASTQGATAQLWAVWRPKTCTVTFDYQLSTEGHGNAGTLSNVTATYDAAMPALSGNMPTAANGYAFMGFFSETGGNGTKYYNADKSSANNWAVNTTSSTTLYAYYKKAEVAEITFDPGTVVENNSTVNVTAVISPEPTGTTTVCWRILYDNGSALDPQPTFTPASRQGTAVSFIAPNASGMYKAEAVLHLGSGCGGSDISTYESNFQVAGSHNVTVAYKQGSTTIKASTIVTGRPLDWSDPITAPEIFGYTFDHWTAGDGITLSADGSTPVGSDESSANPIYITAIYNGTLTANYTPKNIIYFKDNLEWTDPDDADAHIYVNLLTDDYWNTDNGTGNKNVTNRNLQMDRVPGTTDIFYYEYGSKPTSKYISFTKESMNNYEHFYQSGTAHVVFPSRALDALGTDNKDGLGFYAATPMFVPLATQTPVKKNSNHATYYNDGYWTKYLPGTGYTLQIYNAAGNVMQKQIEFTSADELMPMKVVTDLEGNHTYKFQLKRDGDVYYGNNGTMTYADHGQNTAWDFFNNSPFNMCTIVTTAAGDYTFNLSYSPNSGGTNNRLRISVDYPVASGDYRLVYKDDVHTKMHPSAIVNKVNDGTDIVSFFVRKDENPKLYIQQATVNPSTGAITWNEYPNSGTPTNQITGAIASAITTDTVYNFNLSMNGSGALTVASAEYYSGNYYIRTDAANSKWDNYRTDPDHLMTYSDYLKTDVGYSHYYTHWVRYTDTGRKNVKFVIANDYSPCISDTLAREEATGTWANIATFMEEGGDLKRSANVRFMWDIKTNAIARAYIDGAQEDGTHFLELLSADGKIKNTAETETLTAVTFSDNGNWIYEANIKAQPDAQIKLKSTWGEGTTIVQYFKGGADAEDTETLIGGSGDNWYPIRVLYDFKTNRLVAAYVPTTGTYNTEDPINADVMFIREHQGDIAQLTFGGSGAISDIKTAYGVLRLNKWTINNKSKSAGHAPLVPELSRFERDLFYISFPFRVNLEEVFGFGTYGTHWIVEEYDGAGRAANGFWKDTPTFWRFITNRKGKFLEPNIGYIVALDLDELGETSSVWANTDQVELYFPSYGSMPDIKSSSVTHEVPAHTCTINRPTPKGDRRVADSHWNVMSVPTYINTNNVSFANTDWITTATETSVGPKFLYTVNWNDNSLTATNGVGYTYHAMHAYIVQYCGNVTWTTSVSPALAPRRNPDAPKDAEFCIELQQNEAMIDRTFVRLTDDEAVTSGFEFNYDMSKEFNKNKANIYTMVTTIMEDGPSVTETAGNCLPLTDQTTIVPMGVQIATTGDYTFSIPSGTNGVGVTLVDNETGIRTNLALMDYTIALEAGTQDDRFYLEISPIKHVATDIENTDAGDHVSNVRKMMVDGLLYIIKDGKVFDAHGARVK